MADDPKELFRNLITAIFITWLVAGTMDGLAAIIQSLLKGSKHPENIFKYIASAVFGKEAMTGGTGMILLGILFHYLVALSFTLFFFWLYPQIPWIGNHPAISGILYGLFVWTVMNLVVVPMTKIGHHPIVLSKAVTAALILIFCIGLPISLLANKHYLYKK